MKLLALLFVLSGCSLLSDKHYETELTIFHTNDHHGNYLSDKKGQKGMAARKTLLDKLRLEVKSKGADSLLLSGGDINTGTMESDIFDAEPDFKGMQALGYDAMAVGNHEFDNSYTVIKKQKRLAGFPFLAANIYWKNSNRRLFEPAYIIKEFKGVKIGIFGLTTKDTPFKASHQDAKRKFDFRNTIDESKIIVGELKQKVDFIIAVTHIGHHGSATSNGDIKLAKAVSGIDVIVGGHSQEIINAEFHNNTIIVQAKDWGQYLGRLDLKIGKRDEKSGESVKKQISYKLIPINLKKKVNGEYVYIDKKIDENIEMLKLFAPYKRKAEKIGNRVAGKIDNDLSGERFKVRSQQMPIAQFMGKSAMRKVSGIDLMILNGGSIRGSLKKGRVTRRDIHGVHPYGNTIATVEFTPEELLNYFDVVGKYSKVDKKFIIGGYPQFVGAKFKFDNNMKVISIEENTGKWFVKRTGAGIKSSKKKITLGTMNFLARGGDDYPKIHKHPTYIDTGFMINMAMIEYIEAKGFIRTILFRP